MALYDEDIIHGLEERVKKLEFGNELLLDIIDDLRDKYEPDTPKHIR